MQTLVKYFESLKPQNSKCIWPLPDVLSGPQSNQTNIEKQKKIGLDMFCMQSREMAHKKAIFCKEHITWPPKRNTLPPPSNLTFCKRDVSVENAFSSQFLNLGETARSYLNTLFFAIFPATPDWLCCIIMHFRRITP